MRFAVSSLVAIAAAVFVAAQASAPELSASPPSVHLPGPQTNAKRLAAGLPLLPPKIRHRGHIPNGGSRADTARRGTASPSVPISKGCNILVKKASDGSSLGYIAPAWGTNGVYSQFQPTQAGSLEVAFSYSADNPSSLSQMDMVTTGGLTAAYPYLGVATVGSSVFDMRSGVLRYFFISGTSQTPKGSPPVQTPGSYSTLSNTPGSRAESAIWKFNPTTLAITAQWINPDGSLPVTYLAYATQKLVITGDLTRLASSVSGSYEVTFICVPPVTSLVPK